MSTTETTLSVSSPVARFFYNAAKLFSSNRFFKNTSFLCAGSGALWFVMASFGLGSGSAPANTAASPPPSMVPGAATPSMAAAPGLVPGAMPGMVPPGYGGPSIPTMPAAPTVGSVTGGMAPPALTPTLGGPGGTVQSTQQKIEMKPLDQTSEPTRVEIEKAKPIRQAEKPTYGVWTKDVVLPGSK